MTTKKKNWIIVGLTAIFYGCCLGIQNFYSKKLVKDLKKKKDN